MPPAPSLPLSLLPHRLISKVSHRSDSSLPSAKHLRLSKSVARYLDVSMQEDDEDEDEDENENEDGDEDNLDIRVKNHPKVMEPTLASAARFILEHLKLENLPCWTFPLLPKHIFVEACNLLEVQICLPPSHNTLIKNIILIPAEEMQSITQPHDIPVQSWICNLSGPFKNDIPYVLSADADSVEMLVVPQEVPYYSTPQDLYHGHTLFDVDLARAHGLEVTVSTDEEGHLVTSCEGREYHCGCTHFFSCKNEIKVVNVPSPDKITWFALTSIDPPLVDCTMTSFSAQWWQDGDTGRIHSGEYAGSLAHVITMDSQCELVTIHVLIPGSSDEVVKDLENSIHDFRLEFLPGTSVKVIAGMNHGFEGMLEVPEIFLALHVFLVMYMSRDPHDQLLHDPYANKSCIQPGDLVWVVSRPHKGLSGMLHYHSSHEIFITPSTLPEESADDPRNKGKLKAQESEVAGGDSNINENSDLIQVSVSIDNAIIIPPSTLQLLKERGYDVSVGNCVQVACGPAVGAVDFPSGRLMVLSEDGPWNTMSVMKTLCMVGIHSDIMQLTNTAVVTESGMLLSRTPLDSTRMAAFIALHQRLFAEIAPPHCTTPPLSLSAVDPLTEPGPTTSTSNPWVINADDATTPHPNKAEKQKIHYGM
ncbi:hypothetical protein EDC04DRAFT_2905638 [Pisolithus marmoratus]|nr:hypothetical protein EDC04DRAFT_2905638 [Pisolithus marmoratus]